MNATLETLEFTHVIYNPHDPLSFIFALFTLIPIALASVFFPTLIFIKR